jgi:hypothetical protein
LNALKERNEHNEKEFKFSKVCLVLRWIYHLSKVISLVEMSTNLQLCKLKKLWLDFNSNECNS